MSETEAMSEGGGGWLTAERKMTIIGMAIGTPAFVAFYFSAYFVWWPDAPATMSRTDIVFSTLRWGAAIGLVTAIFMQMCFRLFDTPKAEDPFAGAESRRLQTNQKILTNTVEQAVIFFPALLGMATFVDASQFKAVPILVTTWVLGRFMFWAGYHANPGYRGPGLQFTLYSGLTALAWIGYLAFIA